MTHFNYNFPYNLIKSARFILFILLGYPAFSQSREVQVADSVLQTSIRKADSVTFAFQKSVDSIGSEFNRQLNSIQTQERNLHAKLDSFQNLNLPSSKLTQKLDSLKQLKNEKLSELTKKLDEIKSKANVNLQALQLPAEFQEPLQKLQSSIENYSLPELQLSSMNMPTDLALFEKVKIPSFTEQLKSYPALKNLAFVGVLHQQT